MTFARLLLRNLLFHWRGNSAVLLGVAVGTAVLTGALLVGDSLRGSLREVAVRQLGQVDQVLVANRLFRQDVAEQLRKYAAKRVAPALVLNGAVTGEKDRTRRAGRVSIYAIDDHFWSLWPDGAPPVSAAFWGSREKQIVLNDALAAELGVKAGDTVVLNVQRPSEVPRESLLGRQEAGEVVDELRVTVAAVLPATTPGGRFSLNPGPAVPRNAFVPLATLQEFLAKPRGNQPAPGVARPINAVLVADASPELQDRLAAALSPDDWGLTLRTPQDRAEKFFFNLDRRKAGNLKAKEWPRLGDRAFFQEIAGERGKVDTLSLGEYYRKHHNYSSLESRQLFLEDAIVRAAQRAAQAEGLTAAPTLVYLADSLSSGPHDEVTYAVVAALDPTLPPPLGPFLPPGINKLADDEIVLLDLPQSPLASAREAKEINVAYYDPEVPDKLRTRPFRVAGWVPLAGAADDPDLTPEFPGITDKQSLTDWDPPRALHYDSKRLAKPLKKGGLSPDEEYWQRYRTTPKAYVNLATGQKLWGTRFGKVTSIRLAPAGEGIDLGRATARFEQRLLRELKPEQGGFVFDPVRQRALESGAQGMDFGMLFLAFSCFIIAAALLLVGLLFRLNLDRRAEEIGLLLAVGWRRGTVRSLLLLEGTLLALVGGVLGSVVAVGYAWFLLERLREWWPGDLDRSFLQFHATWQSFAIGYGAALAVSVLTIVWATRVLAKVSPRGLLAGQSSDVPPGLRHLPILRIAIAIVAIIGAAVCIAVAPAITDHETQASLFFTSGFLLLVAGLIGVWWLLRRESVTPRRHLVTLGMSNAGRHPTRSLLTAGLLASATFLIVAVESFHRDAGAHFLERTGGSGGFALYGESDVPLFLDLGGKRAQDELDFALQEAQVPADERAVVGQAQYFSCRLRAGDDASCLNLAQPRKPRLLGLPHGLVERGGFAFAAVDAAATPAEKANPWLLLEKDYGPNVVPVIGEANTVAWMLKSGLGQEIEVPDETGQPVKLRFVALLQDSLFQSELVLSDAYFRRLYPRDGGYKFFLIEPPAGREKEVRRLLERGLANHGLTVDPTRKRVEAYLEVENTYLATFQALGGLGLVLGALGLAVVLLRSVWERRGELALLRALGFRRSALGWLVLAENCYLLTLGLGVGLVAALASVAPHGFGGGGAGLWLRLAGLLLVVVVVGLGAGALAVAATLRAPLVPALRRE
jgi:ABC-type lipoprotein release transport system permease subunit